MPSAQVTRYALDATSWVDVVPGFLPSPAALHDRLGEATTWQQGRVWRYERWIDEPRLGAWAEGDARHPALVEAGAWLEDRYAVDFEHRHALALYRHERDGVAWHRDREMRWLDDTVIAVLTLGAARPWRLRPRTTARRPPDDDDDLADAVELCPRAGDLLVMGGRCQADWLHTVPQLRTPVAPRISVQWRWTSRRGAPDTQPSYFAPRRFSR
ncbi:MAG TPA: alpha-ketoglutarate-dependent dioxygenase AlkB [Acidimicrobiales bacterium]|nr:alpha-ketoglutarate-dependent dioxygenase AlkB [Acidimicrobiales bacterium]